MVTFTHTRVAVLLVLVLVKKTTDEQMLQKISESLIFNHKNEKWGS